MAKNSQLVSSFYLIAVDLSVKLNDVLQEAQNISLEAMNAKALVARAGDNVRTFKPITDFMVTLADETISLVEDINKEARNIAMISLDGLKDLDVFNKIKKAQILADTAPFKESMTPVLMHSSRDLHHLERVVVRKSRILMEYLEEIEQRMLAVQVATSTSRLEAARVSDIYRDNFETIVYKFEKAARAIRATVLLCRKSLLEGSTQIDRITLKR